ncbi:PBS lyase [Pseudomonas sp. BP8]|uniref:PBS lyase n=1 Tax=Pseudomonas sp. BP8 TaxID=2817864 RepID=UPI001AE7D175|nr:HEAT repeat protein [Pseudomonas sp. BP8]HDS1733832.1 PBS lyase [Pseudomonas putida]
MTSIKDWLDRHQQKPALSWADRRRNTALETLASLTQDESWVALSNHHDGFVREIAVRELRNQPSPEALVALLERLNDWAPEVREVAAAGLAHYLQPSQAPALLYALESLMALAGRHRADHSQTLQAVRAVLQSPGIREGVHQRFLASQGKTARYLFALLLEHNGAPQALLRSALAHRELTVRLMAVAACQALPGETARALLSEALTRPGAKVRVNVLRALLPLLDDSRPVLRQALLDASPAIRSLARWSAARSGVDALAVLAARLTEGLPAGKREWLGVLGLASDLEVQLPQAWHMTALRAPYSTVRQAAVHLLRDEHVAESLVALDDPADRVFLAAVAHLHEQPWASVKSGLDTLLDKAWHALPTARREALMHVRPAWQQVSYLLYRLQAEPVAQRYWLAQLEQWCERQYQVVDPVTPKAQRADIVEQLRRLAGSGLIASERIARVAD